MKKLNLFISFLILLFSIITISCRKEYVKGEDVIEDKKDNTVVYKLENDITDLTKNLRDYIIEESDSIIILQNKDSISNHFKIGKIYFNISTIQLNVIPYAYKCKSIALVNDRVIIEKELLNFIDTYVDFDLEINDITGSILKTRNKNPDIIFDTEGPISTKDIPELFDHPIKDELTKETIAKFSLNFQIGTRVYVKRITVNNDKLIGYSLNIENANWEHGHILTKDNTKSVELLSDYFAYIAFGLPFLNVGVGLKANIGLGGSFKLSTGFGYKINLGKDYTITLGGLDLVIDKKNEVDFADLYYQKDNITITTSFNERSKSSTEFPFNLSAIGEANASVGIGLGFFLTGKFGQKTYSLFYEVVNGKLKSEVSGEFMIKGTIKVPFAKDQASIENKAKCTSLNAQFCYNSFKLVEFENYIYLTLPPPKPLGFYFGTLKEVYTVIDENCSTYEILKSCDQVENQRIDLKFLDFYYDKNGKLRLFYGYYSYDPITLGVGPARKLKFYSEYYFDGQSSYGFNWEFTTDPSSDIQRGNLYYNSIDVSEIERKLIDYSMGNIDNQRGYSEINVEEVANVNQKLGKFQIFLDDPEKRNQEYLPQINIGNGKMKSFYVHSEYPESFFGDVLTFEEFFGKPDQSTIDYKKGRCKEGFHVPDFNEWKNMINNNPMPFILNRNNRLIPITPDWDNKTVLRTSKRGLNIPLWGIDLLNINSNRFSDGSRIVFITSKEAHDQDDIHVPILIFKDDNSYDIDKLGVSSIRGYCLCLKD